MGKIYINKKQINDNIYKLLEENIIDKIIRHYKLIKSKYVTNELYKIYIGDKCVEIFDNENDANTYVSNLEYTDDVRIEKNNHYELQHDTDEYDNIFYADPINADNEYLDDTISFGQLYDNVLIINDIINNAKNDAYNNFKEQVVESDFTTEEIHKLQDIIINFNNDVKNHLYIRLGINKEDKEQYLLELFKIYITNYFNDLTEEKQQELLNNTLLPIFNDSIIYSTNKYDKIENQNINEYTNLSLNKKIKDL